MFNPKKASAPLKEAIAEAEKDLRIKILQVVVGLPKYYVKQESASGKVPRGEEAGCITEEEVENLKEMALESYPLNDEKNEVMYGAVAQSFSTEDSFQQKEILWAWLATIWKAISRSSSGVAARWPTWMW